MPSNKSLCRYEDKYFTTSIGRISYSINYHELKTLLRMSGLEVEGDIRQSATGLVCRIRTNAPFRFGDLQSGIIPSETAERSATPGKIVFDVMFDAKMNDKFVKISKAGKRYYYPASQEYGFRIGRGRKKPGLYYMRDTSIEYFPIHEKAVADGVERILKE